MTDEELIAVVKSLAASVVHHDDLIEAHDRQIENLIKVADKHFALIAELRESIARTEKQWQAYVNTLRPQ